jgi:signal transduction histidine kinase
MESKGRAAAPRKLVALIAVITIVPLGLFVWLGLRLLQQDRALEQQQARERLQIASDLIVATLQRSVASAEQQLASGAGEWPDGVVAVTLHPDRVDVQPPRRVAFVPVVPPPRHTDDDAFRAAEALEFHKQDWAGAIRMYRSLAASELPAIRAGALLRLARTLAAAGRDDEALTTYGGLLAIDDVPEAGVPAGLAAAWAACTLLERSGRAVELKAQADGLYADLVGGRWAIGEATYLTYLADAERWAGKRRRSQPSERLAAAISRVWTDRTRGSDRGPRRNAFVIDGEVLTVLWQSSGMSSRVLIAAPSFVGSKWLAPASAVARDQMVGFQAGGDREDAVRFDDAADSRVFSGAPEITVSRAQSELPWTLTVWSTAPRVSPGFRSRQRLMIGAFALLATLSLAASWLIVRAVTRELAVARLQSDFVAAVSHEFRTPLTALRQFTDRLRDQPDLDSARRRICYEAQSRATDRLTRLVESVLDFGRMEAGARTYRFEARDCADIVQRVVDDFRAQPQAAGRVIELHRNGSVPVDADEEALSRALWNLLDNAVKYSPDGGPVEVGLARGDGFASIAVRDHGLGIPPHEQAAIFGRFQRGAGATLRGIKGTGIGLAMVDHIVRAHHGRIDVDSRPGAGSTFTIVLPQKG